MQVPRRCLSRPLTPNFRSPSNASSSCSHLLARLRLPASRRSPSFIRRNNTTDRNNRRRVLRGGGLTSIERDARPTGRLDGTKNDENCSNSALSRREPSSGKGSSLFRRSSLHSPVSTGFLPGFVTVTIARSLYARIARERLKQRQTKKWSLKKREIAVQRVGKQNKNSSWLLLRSSCAKRAIRLRASHWTLRARSECLPRTDVFPMRQAFGARLSVKFLLALHCFQYKRSRRASGRQQSPVERRLGQTHATGTSLWHVDAHRGALSPVASLEATISEKNKHS